MTKQQYIDGQIAQGRMPITCADKTTPNGNMNIIGTYDITGIYFFCRKCHRQHRLSRQMLLLAWEEMDRHSSLTLTIETKQEKA